jgi:hypothetical protein
VRHRLAFALITATVDGAVTVFLFLALVLPPPTESIRELKTAQVVNLCVFVAYLTVSVIAGTVWSKRRLSPLYMWLERGWPATEVGAGPSFACRASKLCSVCCCGRARRSSSA